MTVIFSITLEQKCGRRVSQVCLIQAAWSPLIPNDLVASHCALFSFSAIMDSYLFDEDEGKWGYLLSNNFDRSRPTAVTSSLLALRTWSPYALRSL